MKRNLLIFLCILWISVFHSAPDLTGGDSCELASCASMLNIPHYGSSQLYVIFLRPFIDLLSFFNISPIRAATLFSSFCLSCAFMTVFILIEEFTASSCISLGMLGYLVTSFIASAGFRAEVYGFNLFLFSLAFYLLISPRESGRTGSVYLSIFLFFLLFSVHISNLVFLPLLFYAVWNFRSVLNWKKILFVSAAGLSPFLFLLIRSFCDPVWSYGLQPSLSSFFRYFTGAEKNVTAWFFSGGSGDIFFRLKDLLRLCGKFLTFLLPFPVIIALFSEERFSRNLLFLAAFLNFGFFLSVPAIPTEKFYFFLPGLLSLFIAASQGISVMNKKQFCQIFSLVLLLSSLLNYYQLQKMSLRNDFLIRQYVMNSFEILPDNSILSVEGDELVFPFFYIRHVERKRPDLKVFSRSMLETDWYSSYIRKETGLDPEKLKRIGLYDSISTFYSESLQPEWENSFFCDCFGHLSRMSREKPADFCKNSRFWERVSIPYTRPVSPGEDRIISLYTGALRNQSIESAENLDFPSASMFNSIAQSVKKTSDLLMDAVRIRENAALFGRLPDISDPKERFSAAVTLHNDELILSEADRFYQRGGKDHAAAAILEILRRNRRFNEYYEKISLLSTEDLRTFYHAAGLYSQGFSYDARAMLASFVAKNGYGFKNINLLLARILISDDILQGLGGIIDNLPETPDGYNLLALYHYKKEDFAKAVHYWKKTIVLSPSDQTARAGLRSLLGPEQGKI